MNIKKHSRCQSSQRSAVAAVEMAICMPMVVLIVFGALEACSMISVQQAIQAAAYEGVRVGIRGTGTTASVESTANSVLSGHGVVQATVSCTPSDIGAAKVGTQITVTVSTPCRPNLISPGMFFGSRTLTAKAVMVKEASQN